jgi:hypothetical protein
MRNISNRLAVVCATLVVASTGIAHADDNAPVFDYMQKSVAAYSMQLRTKGGAGLTFRRTPIYQWTVQISGRNDGAVFVWLGNGRPEVVGCVVTRPSKRIIYHEFHSLSGEAVTATLHDRKIWYPDKPGLRMHGLSNASKPSDNATQRRIQMRNLAQKFSVSVVHQKDNTRWETRMLARPVYRYSEVDGGLIDGGLFLFVRANDPQLLLLVEARLGAAGRRWEYATARLSSNEISINYEGQLAHTISKWPWRFKPTDSRPRNEPYAQFMMGTYPADPATEE